MLGITTLAAEVSHVSKHGFWLSLADEELLVPFDQFPWFRKGTIEQISDVQWPTPDHFIGRGWTSICRCSPSEAQPCFRWFRAQRANSLLVADTQPHNTASRRWLRAGQR